MNHTRFAVFLSYLCLCLYWVELVIISEKLVDGYMLWWRSEDRPAHLKIFHDTWCTIFVFRAVAFRQPIHSDDSKNNVSNPSVKAVSNIPKTIIRVSPLHCWECSPNFWGSWLSCLLKIRNVTFAFIQEVWHKCAEQRYKRGPQATADREERQVSYDRIAVGVRWRTQANTMKEIQQTSRGSSNTTACRQFRRLDSDIEHSLVSPE